jgi:hypothetical protein
MAQKPKHPPGPPMALGNMRRLGVQRLVAYCLNPLCRHEGLTDFSENQMFGGAQISNVVGVVIAPPRKLVFVFMNVRLSVNTICSMAFRSSPNSIMSCDLRLGDSMRLCRQRSVVRLCYFPRGSAMS